MIKLLLLSGVGGKPKTEQVKRHSRTGLFYLVKTKRQKNFTNCAV